MKTVCVFLTFLIVQVYSCIQHTELKRVPGLPDLLADTQPYYIVSVRNAIRAAGAVSLGCTAQYGQLMETRALEMGLRLNDRIANRPDFCSADDNHKIRMTGAAFQTQGTTGTVFADFLIYPKSNSSTINSMYPCSRDIHEHVMNHINWPRPILPTPARCPPVTFTGTRFENNGDDWVCALD